MSEFAFHECPDACRSRVLMQTPWTRFAALCGTHSWPLVPRLKRYAGLAGASAAVRSVCVDTASGENRSPAASASRSGSEAARRRLRSCPPSQSELRPPDGEGRKRTSSDAGSQKSSRNAVRLLHNWNTRRGARRRRGSYQHRRADQSRGNSRAARGITVKPDSSLHFAASEDACYLCGATLAEE